MLPKRGSGALVGHTAFCLHCSSTSLTINHSCTHSSLTPSSTHPIKFVTSTSLPSTQLTSATSSALAMLLQTPCTMWKWTPSTPVMHHPLTLLPVHSTMIQRYGALTPHSIIACHLPTISQRYPIVGHEHWHILPLHATAIQICHF